MTSWNEEERKNRSNDHDLLIQIDTKLDSFFNAFEKHVQSDEDSFKAHDFRLKNLEKALYAGIGGLAILEVFIRIVFK